VPKDLPSWPELSDTYQPWQAVADTIPEPIGGLRGDPDNGLEVVVSRSKGNCVACHVMPIPAVEFHGELGPPLVGVGNKFSAAQLRLRVVDIQKIRPHSVMPAYYLDPDQLHRVAKIYRGRTILTAQEVEDVVAYLVTLK
jgi:L-cysteine S-thiosulfotransferase